MNYTIFIISSGIVLAALIVSFACWIAVYGKTSGMAKASAMSFVLCFGLYIVGQSLALLQGTGVVQGFWAIPSLCYAVAALIFAVGSWQQLRSMR